MANCSTNDATKYVPTIFIAWKNTVVNQHGCRAGMFGQYAKRETAAVFVVALFVDSSRHSFCFLDERIQNIGLPNGVNSLNESQNAFESSPSIDTWFRKGCACSVTALVVLHEYQVPELHKAITCWIVCWPTVGTKGRAAIDMDFRARTAWSSVTGLPEVVFVSETLNSLHRNAHLFMPDFFCLVIGFMNSDPQFVAVKTEYFSH